MQQLWALDEEVQAGSLPSVLHALVAQGDRAAALGAITLPGTLERVQALEHDAVTLVDALTIRV